jgi:hypothetical protein
MRIRMSVCEFQFHTALTAGRHVQEGFAGLAIRGYGQAVACNIFDDISQRMKYKLYIPN